MKQKAGDNSKQLQVEHVHIYQGVDSENIRKLCLDLIQRELALYKQEASDEAMRRFNFLMEKFLELFSKLEEDKRQRLKEPAIQVATNETFNEYIVSGEEPLGNELIDLLIERISVDEHTSMQLLIDESRRILPKLTKNLIDFLAVITFMSLLLPRSRKCFDVILNRVGNLGANFDKIKSLDIALLKQTGCTTYNFISNDKSVERILLENYDSFFRRAVSLESFIKLLQSYPVVLDNPHSVSGTPVGTLLQFIETEDKECYFRSSTYQSANNYQKAFSHPENGILLRKFDTLAVKMMETEVRDYLIGNNEDWKKIMRLFSQDYIHALAINPVGYYIGLRHLCKQIGEDIPYSVFYPNH